MHFAAAACPIGCPALVDGLWAGRAQDFLRPSNLNLNDTLRLASIW